MNRYLLFIALMVGILLVMLQQSSYGRFGEEVADQNDVNSVTIALTHLDVNDTKLELSYKIKNNTDHDVWICDDISFVTTMDFEVYLSEDEQTLMIRRRHGVPTEAIFAALPVGHYVLLCPEQERTESIVLFLPVSPSPLFVSTLETSVHAKRLILEIGFYNEDLPHMIRDILEMAEKLNCADIEVNDDTRDFFARYFNGIWIAHMLGGLSWFDEYTYKEGDEEIKIPYFRYSRQNFNEQVLRIEVNGVNIPYDVNAPIHSDNPPPPKGRACFPAETPVWVDGMLVPISKVTTGQAVRRSLCTTPGSLTDQVEEVQEHTDTFPCRDIVLESGNHIGVVGNHYFMLATGEWIAAQDLKSGLSLRTFQGTVKIKSVKVRTEQYTGKVYNLKIKNSDEYVVGIDGVIVRDF